MLGTGQLGSIDPASDLAKGVVDVELVVPMDFPAMSLDTLLSDDKYVLTFPLLSPSTTGLRYREVLNVDNRWALFDPFGTCMGT